MPVTNQSTIIGAPIENVLKDTVDDGPTPVSTAGKPGHKLDSLPS